MAASNEHLHVTYTTVKDLYLSEDIITDVNITDDGDIQIVVDSELDSESTNPVQNKVILSALDKKLNCDEYNVDTALNSSSSNPVQNKAVNAVINRLVTRVSELERLNSI